MARSQEAPLRRDRVVVVVDDEPANCALVRATLLGQDVADAVHEVTDPREAVRVIDDTDPDCVLLDLRMPHVDGMALLRDLRRTADGLQLPIIVMTADDGRETAHRAFEEGASDFVRKPFDLLELTRRVETRIESRRIRAELDRMVRRRSKQVIQLDAILNAVDIFMWMLDPATGERVYTNDRATAPDGAALWLVIEDEVDLSPTRELRQERLRHGEGDDLVAYDVIRQDVDAGGQRYVLVAAYETTERERARQALEDALAREELAHQALHELDAARTRFLTATSHELRTPLTVIRGTIEVARHHLGEHTLTPMFEAALRQSRRLNDLLTDLVLVADGSAGALDLRPVPLASVVQSAVSRAGLADRVDVRTVPLIVEADSGLVERCVVALVDNAARYGPPDGRIVVAIEEGPEGAAVAVEDQGPGIRRDLRERVFEPFARGAAGVDHDPGTGIGLTVARLIARAHGGDVEIATSTELGGARVALRLPAAVVVTLGGPGGERLQGRGRGR